MFDIYVKKESRRFSLYKNGGGFASGLGSFYSYDCDNYAPNISADIYKVGAGIGCWCIEFEYGNQNSDLEAHKIWFY